MIHTLSSQDIQRFRSAVARGLGLRFEDDRLVFLADVLRSRLNAVAQPPTAYLARLETGVLPDELGALARTLTVTETHFFRSSDQFRALAQTALPDRIAARASARSLREAFDRSFALAQAVSIGAVAVEGFVAIKIGSNPYALRLADLSGLFVDKRITRLPSPVAELMGIATVRGTVVPVYDLGMLLGYPPANAPRWLVVTAASPVGLAFGELERYLAAQPEAVAQEEVRAESRDRHVREVLQTDIAQPVIHLLSVLETIKSLGDHVGRSQQTRSEER